MFWPGEFHGVRESRTRLNDFKCKLFQVRFFSFFPKGNINIFPLKIKRNSETFSNSLNMNELKRNKHQPTTSEDFKRTNEKIHINMQLLLSYSVMSNSATPWTTAHQASLSITNSQSVLKLMCIKSLMPPNHLILCRPLLPPSIFPSIRVLFPMSQFFTSGGQSIGASASASVLPVNIQDWFPLRWTGLISLLSKVLSRVFSTTVQKHQFNAQVSLWSNLHICTGLLEKP